METTIARRAVCWNRARATSPAAPIQERPKLTTPAAAPTRTVSRTPHAVANYSRPLTEKEEALIKREFLKLNGVFDPLKKDCTRIRDRIGGEVTVFQVSGYVTKLHNQVKAGTLELEDRRAYMNNIRAHRKHWLTYNGEKYDEMRERAGVGQPRLEARPAALSASRSRHKMK